jgi:uncharacterized protein YhjY with autotransporter beta-barrel domain
MCTLPSRNASVRRSLILVFAMSVGIGLLSVTQPERVAAQVLNQRVNELLANNCRGDLNVQFVESPPNSNRFVPVGLGPNLTKLCGVIVLPGGGGGNPPPTFAASLGGGSASVQGSAASILNRALLQRLNETDEEEGQAHTQSSSIRFNPFGSLLSGFGRPSSVSSPLYAATSGDGSSSASFATSSHSRWNGLGFFASGLVESLNREVTTFQDGYRSMIFGFTGGVDYRISNKLVTGLLFNYTNTDGDFRGGGNFSTNSYGGLLFASYLPTEKTFVQVTGGYTRNKYLVSRLAQADITLGSGASVANAQGLASSNSHGDIFNLGFLAGYDYPIGRFTIGPRTGVNYSNTTIDDYGERGSTGVELRYDDQWINSLQSVLGIQGSAAFSTGLGVLVPQFNADFIHEFANSQRFITVQFAEDFRDNPTKFRFQNDVPVRNYFNLGTGLLMVLPNGWQSFVNFRAMVGNEQFDNYAGMFGLRVAL